MGRIAIFIDAAYLQFMLKEDFASPKIDLVATSAARYRALRSLPRVKRNWLLCG
jgi:hypothetical protein